LSIEALIADLAWDPDRTEDAEQAWADLANHLGFSGQRPEKETGAGSDVLWSDSEQNHFVIEVKSGATNALVSKRDINQLGGSVRWATQTLTGVNRVVPLIVHPSRTVERSATPPEGARSVDTVKLDELVVAVRSYATALAVDNQFRQAQAVREQLVRLHLNGLEFPARYGATLRNES